MTVVILVIASLILWGFAGAALSAIAERIVNGGKS